MKNDFSMSKKGCGECCEGCESIPDAGNMTGFTGDALGFSGGSFDTGINGRTGFNARNDVAGLDGVLPPGEGVFYS